MYKYTKDNIITCGFCYLALSLFIVVSPVMLIIIIILAPFFEGYQRLFNKECESMETCTDNLRKFEQHAYDNFINQNPSIKYSIYEELVKINPGIKQVVQTDPTFEPLRNMKRYKDLIK